jgi:isochorismate pyruvate lyase
MSNLPEDLQDLRVRIDATDEKLVRLLAERQQLIDKVIAVKKREGIAARLPQRVEDVLLHVKDVALAEGVDPALVQHLWRELIEWSIAREEEALGRPS